MSTVTIQDYVSFADGKYKFLTTLIQPRDYVSVFDAATTLSTAFLLSINEYTTIFDTITKILACCGTVTDLVTRVATLETEVVSLERLISGWSIARYLEESQNP